MYCKNIAVEREDAASFQPVKPTEMRRALQLCMRQSGGAALMRVAGLSSRARADSADGSHSESDADGMRPLSVSSHSWQVRLPDARCPTMTLPHLLSPRTNTLASNGQ
jgi:hypothetical protein